MNVSVSFEVFPPKTAAGLDKLAATVRRLDGVRPTYLSITYGAGGSDRHRSFQAAETVGAVTSAPIACHLTCVGQSRDEIGAVIDRYLDLGIEHIVALRGDPPDGIDAPYEPHPDGFRSTAELVAAIKRRGDVTVSVSSYPERHPQSPTDEHDLDVLAAKVEAGADQAITQMLFDTTRYVDYVERVRARGIEIPVVPGIFPIHSFPTVARFAAQCGATIPSHVVRRFDGLTDDEARCVAVDVAAEQICELAEHGVEHVHVYTLNRPDLVVAVCERLSLVAS